MQIFVLGGTGIIGAAMVRELVARGHELFGLARAAPTALPPSYFRVTVKVAAPLLLR